MESNSISLEAHALLEKGASVFNEWRLNNIETRINFSERKFIEADFSGYFFINIDLYKTSFEGSILDDSIFSNSKIQETDFYGVRAHNAVSGIPEFINVNVDPVLQKYLLITANLDCPNFMMADLTGATFKSTNLKGANFHRAFLEFVDFRETNFQEADFSGARLGKTLFTNYEEK